MVKKSLFLSILSFFQKKIRNPICEKKPKKILFSFFQHFLSKKRKKWIHQFQLLKVIKKILEKSFKSNFIWKKRILILIKNDL